MCKLEWGVKIIWKIYIDIGRQEWE